MNETNHSEIQWDKLQLLDLIRNCKFFLGIERCPPSSSDFVCIHIWTWHFHKVVGFITFACVLSFPWTHDPSDQHQESWHLAGFDFWACTECLFSIVGQSDLSGKTLSLGGMERSLNCGQEEVMILGTDQKGLWPLGTTMVFYLFDVNYTVNVSKIINFEGLLTEKFDQTFHQNKRVICHSLL